jgi:oxalate decarboxylase/phosphoglucose isomerase-like protein (cupin superfamily)
MKYSLGDNIPGETRSNEVYTVTDNQDLSKLILSYVKLHRNQSTRGHSHNGIEEVYFFMFGEGHMIVGDNRFFVKSGDVVQVKDGLFHKVMNDGATDMIWYSVYNRSNENNTIYASNEQ